MKVLVPTHYSRAIARIGDALAKYAPCEVQRIPEMRKDTRRSVHIPGEKDGDLVVLMCNGLRDHWQALADRCVARGQRYAVVQIVLRATRHPSTEQWRQLWGKAALVWSYYPLPQWIMQDAGVERGVDFPFYHAPLGADSSIFTPGNGQDRPYTVCTSGFRRNQEGVAECDIAASAIGGKVFQLGPTFSMKSPTTFRTGIDDLELAEMYRRCQFVSGLRRHEGFELPAAEGLLCGARPILFEQSHYRWWFDGFGEFVDELSEAEVAESLKKLFVRGPRRVTDEERSAAVKLFNWETIAKGFWERVLHA